MRFIYDGLILFLRLAVRVGALFSPKMKAFVHGRAGLFAALESALAMKSGRYIWVHCASLGEFEQGRPVIESLRKTLPRYRIIITFFSPSGYEVRKHYDGADVVCYLPWDTASRARRFVATVKPVLAIFVKYEYWHHYISALKQQGVPVISISAIFRPDQIYFRWYGSFYRNILRNVSRFFLQNAQSFQLLHSIGITQCMHSGDTRFDRVIQIVNEAGEVPLAARFSEGATVLVGGSIWPADFDALLPLINEGNMKYIIAPHEITERFLSQMEGMLTVQHVRYSKALTGGLGGSNVLFIDNVGMLSSLYRYGRFAFVGGGFREGLHNILEAACYGLPVCFGNQAYSAYQEANDLIARKSAFAVNGAGELKHTLAWLDSHGNYARAADTARDYVRSHGGATEKIVSYCKAILA